jgi:hypothetical protein
VCIAAACLASACRSPADDVERAWVRIDLPHLRILSMRDSQRTVELARELALFREVVLEVTNIRGEGRRPTHLLVLDAETYRRLAPFGSAGVFYAGARFDSMAISEIPAHQRANQEFSEEHVLRHEYAHFLVANEQTARYPVWFEEGWAELLSTIHVRDEVVLARRSPPPSRRAPRLSRARSGQLTQM